MRMIRCNPRWINRVTLPSENSSVAWIKIDIQECKQRQFLSAVARSQNGKFTAQQTMLGLVEWAQFAMTQQTQCWTQSRMAIMVHLEIAKALSQIQWRRLTVALMGHGECLDKSLASGIDKNLASGVGNNVAWSAWLAILQLASHHQCIGVKKELYKKLESFILAVKLIVLRKCL